MIPNPQTGLVDVVDQGVTPHRFVAMWPIDYKEACVRSAPTKTGEPRFVLKANYTPPADPVVVETKK